MSHFITLFSFIIYLNIKFFYFLHFHNINYLLKYWIIRKMLFLYKFVFFYGIFSIFFHHFLMQFAFTFVFFPFSESFLCFFWKSFSGFYSVECIAHRSAMFTFSIVFFVLVGIFVAEHADPLSDADHFKVFHLFFEILRNFTNDFFVKPIFNFSIIFICIYFIFPTNKIF